MAKTADRACWEARFMRVGDLVLDELGGLWQTLSESQVAEERRARLIRASDELEVAVRAVERALG